MDNKIYNFALIGHSGSGKTTLAARLTATVAENFVSQPDARTEKYVNDINTQLLNHSWPDPTSGEPTQLAFTILRNNREYQISFNDYPGGMIANDSFFRKIVKTPKGNYPDGALLMINCSAEQWKDPAQAEAMQSDFKRMIDMLAEEKQMPTALVITACDRMSPKDKPAFDKFIHPIKEWMKKLNKRECFDVSATGPLADQEHPELKKPCDLEKPFCWLLEQQPHENHGREKIARFAKIIIGILVAGLIFAGGFTLRWSMLIRQRRELNEEIAASESKRDELSSQNSKLEQQVARLQKDEQRLLDDIQKGETKQKGLTGEIAVLESKHSKLSSQNNKLEQQVAQLKKDEQRLRDDIQKKEDKQKRLTAEIAALESRHGKLNSECKKLQRAKDLPIENDRLQAQIGLLNKSRSDDYRKDPNEILKLWRAFEKGAIPDAPGKIRQGDPRYDEVRKEFAESIANYVIKYVADFNSMGAIKDIQDDKKAKDTLVKLKALCNGINRNKAAIPYLKETKLAAFAEDFIKWYDMPVEVSVHCKANKGDEVCQSIKIYFSRLKEITDDSWKSAEEKKSDESKQEEDNTLIRIKLSHPYNGIEYHFGIRTKCTSALGKNYIPDKSEKGFRYYFNPAKDGSEKDGSRVSYESEPGDIRGGTFSVEIKADSAYSSAEAQKPVRLSDLQNRLGRTAEELSQKDE